MSGIPAGAGSLLGKRLGKYEILALLRATIARRKVIACDIVELSPIPGMSAPNFLCAKLIYKILTYRFAAELA